MLSKHEDLNHRLPILTPPLLEHHDQSQVYQFLSQCAMCFFSFVILVTSNWDALPFFVAKGIFFLKDSAPVILCL